MKELKEWNQGCHYCDCNEIKEVEQWQEINGISFEMICLECKKKFMVYSKYYSRSMEDE